MTFLRELFDLDLDVGEDVNVVKAKYRKRAPSYDPEQNPAKKQKTVKTSYVAAAVAEVKSEDELMKRNHSHYLSIFIPIKFVSGGIQYQKTVVDVEASYSRPANGRGEDGDSEEFGDWQKHTESIGVKLLLQMGFQPGKALGKNLQGRRTILMDRDVSQGLSGQVCRYSISGLCRYGSNCKHFHLKPRVKAANVSEAEWSTLIGRDLSIYCALIAQKGSIICRCRHPYVIKTQ